MVTKFNTSTSAGASASGSSENSGSSLKTILIIGGIALAAFFAYRYFVRKKQETVVYIDESED